MDQPITFNVPQLNGEQVRKAGEIASAFTALQKTIAGILGTSADMQIINEKLQEAWLLTNNAIVATSRRVAA